MLKLPKLTIFAFVFCAIALGGTIHHLQLTGLFSRIPQSGVIDQSSSDDRSNQIKEILDRTSTKNIGEELSALGAIGALEAYNCQCTLAGIETPNFQFEEASKCSRDRLYLENDLAQLPSVYKDERTKSSGDFPRVCMTYIMRMAWTEGENKKTNFLGICKDPSGKPVPGAFKACVTENYVTATYNYFTDVTSCLGIPQRDFLPKLYNESGLHVNALGKGFDAGVAQLVGPAISHAQEAFGPLKKEVLSSANESCKRLSPYLQKLNPPSSEPAHRCEIMSLPNNPLLNIFTMATKYRQDMYAIKLFMEKPEFNIIPRMTKLGLKTTDYDKEQLMQILITLGYNSGAKTAVIGLANYLSAVEAGHRTLTKKDFDIGAESLIYSSVNGQTLILTRREKDDDEKWQDRLSKFKARSEELPTLPTRYKASYHKTTVSGPNGSYPTYQLELKPSELSFSAYMQLYQNSGVGGYLSFVARSAKELDKVFKEGTCVPESYLAL